MLLGSTRRSCDFDVLTDPRVALPATDRTLWRRSVGGALDLL